MHSTVGQLASNYYYMTYGTHSKKYSDGKRKSYGLNVLHDHLKQCKAKLKVNSTDKQGLRFQRAVHINRRKFAYYKNALPDKYKLKLKDVELKFVITRFHSFNSLENDGILN